MIDNHPFRTQCSRDVNPTNGEPAGYSPVARAIAAISDERTDLYRLLIRMSLGDNTAPAVATRHALTSLSYQHLNMLFEARYHQTRALAALQSSIETLGPTAKMQAFQSMAASMLLNIYEVGEAVILLASSFLLTSAPRQ